MAMNLFVNLPVKDLAKTKAFFEELGFVFNPQFTDENAACMVINDDTYFMLLTEPFFLSFTKKTLTDTSTSLEVMNAISVNSRDEVNAFVDKAMTLGVTEGNDPQDHGFMYSRSFQDLDGHIWEVSWMDPAALQS